MMSKLSTITDPSWLNIPHAGELLLSECHGTAWAQDAAALAEAIAVDPSRVLRMIDGS